MEFKDYCKIMGVARDATQDEIKRAYRKPARKYHPHASKEANAEVRFIWHGRRTGDSPDGLPHARPRLIFYPHTVNTCIFF